MACQHIGEVKGTCFQCAGIYGFWDDTQRKATYLIIRESDGANVVTIQKYSRKYWVQTSLVSGRQVLIKNADFWEYARQCDAEYTQVCLETYHKALAALRGK